MSRSTEIASLAARLRSAVGSLVTSDVDSLETVPVGANGSVLTADSTQPNGIRWAAAGASGFTPTQVTDLTDAGESALHFHATDRALANATGTLAVANGGTGATTAQAAINTLSNVAAGASGNVLTKSGFDAVWATPSGAGIGDVSGPTASVDNSIASYNGATGKTIKDGGILTSAITTLTGTQTLTNKTIGAGSTWSGNIIGVLSGGTAQSSWVKGDLLYASAANTLSKLPVGSTGHVLASSSAGVPEWVPAGGSVSTVDAAFGDGLINASAAIQSKINIVAAGGGGVVNIPKGVYIIDTTLIIPSYVTVAGSGIDVTTLKLKNSVNVSVVTTTDTSTLVGGTTAGGAKYWGISDLTIDGNRLNNTAGYGIYTYSRTYRVERVKVRGARQDGIFSQWCGSCAAWNNDAADMFMEAYINDVYIMDAGGHGLYYDGPHDGRVNNTITALNGKNAINSSDGIYVGPRAGGTQFTTCHSWGDTQRYDWNINTGYVYCSNCIADDAYTALVYVNGSHFSWYGGHAFGAVFVSPPSAPDLVMKGFILTSNAWHPNIKTTVTDAPGGAIDFTAAPNGSGTISINGSMSSVLNANTTTYGWRGTPPVNIDTQINIFDPIVNDFFQSFRTGNVTDDSSNWYDTGVPGYWSSTGTNINIGTTSNSVNPPVWVQNTTSWSSGVFDHYASCALFETIKTGGASAPNSLTGSIRVAGGTGDAIGIHGQVVCDVTNGGAMTGIWGRATGPTSAPTTGMICGLEVNVDNRHGATSYKARKDNGSLVGMLIYNFSGAGKSNHFGFVLEGTATDAYHVGGLIEDWSYAALKLTGTRSNSFGILLDSELSDQIDKGIAFGSRCASAGIALGDNKFNWGSSTQTVSNNGDMLYNASNSTLYFNQGGSTREIIACSGVGTSASYAAERKAAVQINGITYYMLLSTTP